MHTVIAGGGLAGVRMAIKSAEDPNNRVTLITSSELFLSPLNKDSIRYDDLVAGRGIKLVHDTLVSIDPDRRYAICKKDKYHYNNLILALGNVANKPKFVDINNKPILVDSPASAQKIIKKLYQVFETEKHVKHHYAIVGAGLSGVELAGHIAEAINQAGFKSNHRPTVYLVEKQSRILPTLPKEVSIKAKKQLQKMGIIIKESTEINNIAADYIIVNRTKIPLKNVFWALGLKPHPIIRKHSNIFILGKDGAPFVNDKLEVYRGIYQLSSPENSIKSIFSKTNFLSRLLSGNSQSKLAKQKPEISFRIGDSWAYSSKNGVYLSGKAAAVTQKTQKDRSLKTLFPAQK